MDLKLMSSVTIRVKPQSYIMQVLAFSIRVAWQASTKVF